MSEKTENEAVADLADIAAEQQRTSIATGEVYLVRDGDGGLRVVDTDSYAAAPRHASAARSVSDAASFCAYLHRHGGASTEVYAHTNTSKVVAIIDSHSELPGWQKHRVSLDLEKTKAWLAWENADGHLFAQDEFADFLDDRWSDVLEPDAGVLIDIATTFHAKTNVEFNGGVRLDSGDVKLTFEEKTTAKAGQKGDIEIPKKIKLGLRPYVGGPVYAIWAHFRYRLRGGQVLLGFKLERPENTLEAAFADIVTDIREGRTNGDELVHAGIGDIPIFAGKPSA
ncbi:MAG: DUF2303 family protein [Microbacterium ginsengisoli]|nr:DUF2303 family protein [Microbacterium ginsengisoli]